MMKSRLLLAAGGVVLSVLSLPLLVGVASASQMSPAPSSKSEFGRSAVPGEATSFSSSHSLVTASWPLSSWKGSRVAPRPAPPPGTGTTAGGRNGDADANQILRQYFGHDIFATKPNNAGIGSSGTPGLAGAAAATSGSGSAARPPTSGTASTSATSGTSTSTTSSRGPVSSPSTSISGGNTGTGSSVGSSTGSTSSIPSTNSMGNGSSGTGLSGSSIHKSR